MGNGQFLRNVNISLLHSRIPLRDIYTGEICVGTEACTQLL